MSKKYLNISTKLSHLTEKQMYEILTGLEFSGEIASLGEGVTNFKVGDEVYGYVNAMKG
jgi:NADPH:quinone reductase-like Zn-dependent oxidoreductase